MTSQRVPSNVRRLIGVHGLSATAMGLPWPVLLVAIWDATHSELWLGIAGAARMAPYVLLSWLAGRMADRMNREICVRASLVARAVLLLVTAMLLTAGWVEAAVVAAGLTIACGTPAYPAIAAEMPKLAGRDSDDATGLLVTVEVGAFFVGPALGGLALGWGYGDAGVYAAAGLTLLAIVAMKWVPWGDTAAGMDAMAGGNQPCRGARSADCHVAAGSRGFDCGSPQQRRRWGTEHCSATSRCRRLGKRRTCLRAGHRRAGVRCVVRADPVADVGDRHRRRP